MITNFTICFFGDSICQVLTKAYRKHYNLDGQQTPKDFDIVRALRQGTVGSCVQTSILFFYLMRVVPYLKFSESTIPRPWVRNIANFSLRMGVHVSTILPLRLATFLFSIGTLKHLSTEGGKENLRNNL